jgi:hypothetical protein
VADIPTSISVIILAKFGAPDEVIFGFVPLSLNILGAEVLVALMGSKLEVKTMDLTGDHNGTVAISGTSAERYNPRPGTFQILRVYKSAWC